LLIASSLLILAGGLAGACGLTQSAGSEVTSATTAVEAQAQGDTVSEVSAAPSGVAPDAGEAPPGDSGTAVYPAEAAYTLGGGSDTQDGRSYTASEQDQSAILVSDDGTLTVTNATIKTIGDSSSNDSSSF
jgi:hypothetical protein